MNAARKADFHQAKRLVRKEKNSMVQNDVTLRLSQFGSM